jgi:hypothetical protein
LTDEERDDIQKEIERARDGVGERIDELDRKIRSTLDFKTLASEHAPQLIAGGAAVGFLVGFGFPKALRRIIGFGLPIALIAMRFKKGRENDGDPYGV